MPRVLLTGGARGIGRGIAERFSRAGWDVIAPTRSEMDLSQASDIERFTSAFDIGSVDTLVNNAGENYPIPLGEIEVADLRRILAVNTIAPFLLSRVCGVKMAAKGRGRIVNISSVYGLVGRERRSMYTTTKAALNGMTVALAVELGPRGVLVNAVCPGFVDSELTRQNNSPEELEHLSSLVPLRRLGNIAEIAELVYFLGAEANTYITGQLVAIDGGFLCQ